MSSTDAPSHECGLIGGATRTRCCVGGRGEALPTERATHLLLEHAFHLGHQVAREGGEGAGLVAQQRAQLQADQPAAAVEQAARVEGVGQAQQLAHVARARRPAQLQLALLAQPRQQQLVGQRQQPARPLHLLNTTPRLSRHNNLHRLAHATQ